MTSEQYQESELSPQLAELLKDPVLATALKICDDMQPANGGLRDWKEPHHAHIQLGIDRGYNLYPRLLKALAAGPQKKAEEVQPTYQAPEEEEITWPMK